MHLICACKIHSFSLARICWIECFRHALSYLVTRRAFPAPYCLCYLPTIVRWLSYSHQTHRHPANNSHCSLSNPLQLGSRQSPSSYPPSGLQTLWFAQIEAQFATRNITKQWTRFNYVVAAFSNEYATEIRDLILNLPQEDAYSKLKDLLIISKLPLWRGNASNSSLLLSNWESGSLPSS